MRQFNFPRDSSSSSGPRQQPCYFTLCLNTTHLAWISIGLLTLIMLFILILLFLYKRKSLNGSSEKAVGIKKHSMQRHRPQQVKSQVKNNSDCHKIISNRTRVPNISLVGTSDPKPQSLLRVPSCLLGITPTRNPEPFAFEQQSVRKSGILSPVFYGSDSTFPEGPESHLFCYRGSVGRSTVNSTAAISSESQMAHSTLPTKMANSRSDAYCYCDHLSGNTMGHNTDKNPTLVLERRAGRLQQIVNFTLAQHANEFDQVNGEAMFATGWQQAVPSADILSCGYSSSDDRKQLLQTCPSQQTRQSEHEGYSNEPSDSIPTISTDLIVLNNSCVDSQEPDSKVSTCNECNKIGSQHAH